MFRNMNEEQKKELYWLIAGALMWAGAWFIPEGIWRTLAYIAIYLFVAFEVIIGVFKEFREGEIFSEEFLMTVATVGALILGEFPEAVAVMLLYRVGEWFADLAVDSSRDSVTSLARLRPDRARVIRGGKECEVSPEEVKIGEIMAVQPGERVPLDGVIIKGMTTVDASSLTGESLPQEKAPGDEMFSGCVNISGRVEMRVTAPAGDSAVDRILHMTADGLTEYIGGYDDYLEALKNGSADNDRLNAAQPSAGAVEYREKKEQRSELNRAKSAVARAEKGVASAEAELEEVNTLLARPDIAANYVKAGELSKKANEIRLRLDKLYEEWESAENRLAELNDD